MRRRPKSTGADSFGLAFTHQATFVSLRILALRLLQGRRGHNLRAPEPVPFRATHASSARSRKTRSGERCLTSNFAIIRRGMCCPTQVLYTHPGRHTRLPSLHPPRLFTSPPRAEATKRGCGRCRDTTVAWPAEPVRVWNANEIATRRPASPGDEKAVQERVGGSFLREKFDAKMERWVATIIEPRGINFQGRTVSDFFEKYPAYAAARDECSPPMPATSPRAM